MMFHYVLQNLLHHRGTQCIKVLTLALGLLMSVFLFARIAFELSYDTCYREAENLCVVKTAWIEQGQKSSESLYTIMPIPATLAEELPREIESSAVSFSFYGNKFLLGEQSFDIPQVMADSLYIQTLGLTLLQGNVRDLLSPDALFLSTSAARRVFGSEAEAMGKSLTYDMYGKQLPFVVRGIFADLPSNVSLTKCPQAILPILTLEQTGMATGWNSGGNYEGFVRLHPGTDVEALNQRTSAAIARHIPSESGLKLNVTLTPISRLHFENSRISRMVWIMFALGVVILFTMTLNYVLLSVSSLARRAKAIGVHKCSGATDGGIFRMFMLETGVVVLMALLLMAALVCLFREKMEELVDVPLADLFAWGNLWAPTVVVLLLFLLGGGLPAMLYARIPVTQVFRRYTERRRGWKRTLLFVQFVGAAFIVGMTMLVTSQYRYVAFRDRGWSLHRVATAFQQGGTVDLMVAHLRRQPYVESVATAGRPIYNVGGGPAVRDNQGNRLCAPFYNQIDRDYLGFIGLKLREGREALREDELLVNSAFCQAMGWTDSPLGRQVNGYGTVVGVLESFALLNAPNDNAPIIFEGLSAPPSFTHVHVRLKEPFGENLLRLNREVQETFGSDLRLFEDAEATMADVYRSTRTFRDVTLLASLTILFIILMGLLGYMADEIRLRSKEIAIRKVNGAESLSVLRLLSADVLRIALPALLLGTYGAYEVGRVWVSQFADAVSLPLMAYVVVLLALLLFVEAVMVLRAWRVANENPVLSLRSE